MSETRQQHIVPAFSSTCSTTRTCLSHTNHSWPITPKTHTSQLSLTSARRGSVGDRSAKVGSAGATAHVAVTGGAVTTARSSPTRGRAAAARVGAGAFCRADADGETSEEGEEGKRELES